MTFCGYEIFYKDGLLKTTTIQIFPAYKALLTFLHSLGQTQEGTEVGKELLICWVLGEFSLPKVGKELQP